MFKPWLTALLLAGIACSASAVQGATYYSKVLNASTCYGYAPYDSTVVVPYQHLLYANKGTAFCNLDFSSDWPVQNLGYVLYSGYVTSGQMTVRLCIHSGDFVTTCGPQKTESGGSFVDWVGPPAFPAYATGAFVRFDFPTNGGSRLFDVIPAWAK